MRKSIVISTAFAIFVFCLFGCASKSKISSTKEPALIIAQERAARIMLAADKAFENIDAAFEEYEKLFSDRESRVISLIKKSPGGEGFCAINISITLSGEEQIIKAQLSDGAKEYCKGPDLVGEIFKMEERAIAAITKRENS